MAESMRETSDEQLSSAIGLLGNLIPHDDIQVFSLRHSPATVYTTLTTLWMLTLQRLGGGRSLEEIVKKTLTSHRDILPDNKRVREGTLSENSSAFSAARHRLTVAAAERYLDSVAGSIIDTCPEVRNDRKAFIIDGTTFKLAPTDELREVYPPSKNQLGETVWPILMLTVAHELRSGAALRPEFGAMYGDKNTSEARQAAAIACRIPAGSIVLADAGYGIFSVVHAMTGRGHDVLFRLTKSRFQAMRRKAELIDQTPTSKRYQLNWIPSAKDRKTNPELPEEAMIAVEIHEVALPGSEPLYLVTQMPLCSQSAADLYARRYDVEHDIRDLKVTLGVEKIRAQSEEMVRKEILCSMVAYNLVVQLRRQAAVRVNLPPRRLSFTGVWNTFECCLLLHAGGDLSTWQQRYDAALNMAMKDKLPYRPGRTSPRRAHPKRPKSTKFMRHRPLSTPADTDKLPPADEK